MLRGLPRFRTGTPQSEGATEPLKPAPSLKLPGNKPTQGRGTLYSLRPLREEGGDTPASLPSQTDIRTIADWLLTNYPVGALVDLVHVKDYSAAHELVGAHDAIAALYQLADDMDEEARESHAQAAQATFA